MGNVETVKDLNDTIDFLIIIVALLNKPNPDKDIKKYSSLLVEDYLAKNGLSMEELFLRSLKGVNVGDLLHNMSKGD